MSLSDAESNCVEIRARDEPPDRSNRHSWNPDRYDIGIRMLKDRRDKITGAGKYSDRYKDTFAHDAPKEDKFPLSAKCRDTLEQYRKVSKGERLDVSPAVSTKHHHPNLTTEKMRLTNCSKSNATNDLNKQENALIGYKLVPEGIPMTSMHSASPKTPKWGRKHKDVNIYSVNPGDTKSPPKQQGVGLSLILNGPESTMSHLQNVENIITRLNEKEKKDENLRKFEELLKKVHAKEVKAAPVQAEEAATEATATPEKSQRQSQEAVAGAARDQPHSHILSPIKHSSEVEDLQERVLKDGERGAPFQRDVKERKSMDNAHAKEAKHGKNGHLSRTASDAQDKSQVKRPQRVARERTRKVSRFGW